MNMPWHRLYYKHRKPIKAHITISLTKNIMDYQNNTGTQHSNSFKTTPNKPLGLARQPNNTLKTIDCVLWRSLWKLYLMLYRPYEPGLYQLQNRFSWKMHKNIGASPPCSCDWGLDNKCMETKILATMESLKQLILRKAVKIKIVPNALIRWDYGLQQFFTT